MILLEILGSYGSVKGLVSGDNPYINIHPNGANNDDAILCNVKSRKSYQVFF